MFDRLPQIPLLHNPTAKPPPGRIVCISASMSPSFHYCTSSEESRLLRNMIDDLGEQSALSQNLKGPITTLDILLNPDRPKDRLYLLIGHNGEAMGYIKMGMRELFVAPPPTLKGFAPTTKIGGGLVAINIPCCLDFFVHSKFRRCGYGRLLFDTVSANEAKILSNSSKVFSTSYEDTLMKGSQATKSNGYVLLSPSYIAYDRPSPFLYAFLFRYFGLRDYIPQSCSFLLFNNYWRIEKSPFIYFANDRSLDA